MIIDNIPLKDKKDKVIRLVKTKRFKINYSKPLNAIFMCLNITKHIALSTWIRSYSLSFDCGYISIGIDFDYRLKNTDHTGIDMILKILFFEIEIEFTANRHLEDYEKQEKNNE